MRAAILLSTAALLTSVAAHAQPRVAAKAPTLRLAPVTVAPALRARLASKTKFDASKLSVTYVGSTPVLKIKNGQSYKLSAVDAPDGGSRRVTTPAVPQVDAQRATISTWRQGQRVPSKLVGVNHTSTQTPVRDQGPRSTCVAFANLAGIEAWLKRNENVTKDLSENHAHDLFLQVGSGTCNPNAGVGLVSMLTLMSNGVCAESLFPYTSSCPASVPAACSGSSERYRIGSIYPLSFPDSTKTPLLDVKNTALLEALLQGGSDIKLSIQVAGSDWSNGKAETGTIDVQTDSSGNPAGAIGNHGVLLVGYSRTGDYFLIKNSWGTGWGHAGYGRLSYDYIETYARYGYAILSVVH